MDLMQLEQLDRSWTLAINSLHSSFTDPRMSFFSDKKVWIPFYVALVALMFWKLGWKKALVLLAAVALTVLCCDQFANLIKHWVQRVRPVNDPLMIEQGLHVLEWGGGFSFFSAHAANAFGVACCTSVVFRKHCKGGLEAERKRKRLIDVYTVVMISWAFLVSISRIFVGKHFLGDVVVGAVVGVVFGLIFGCVTNLIIEKFVIHDADGIYGSERASTTENGVQI